MTVLVFFNVLAFRGVFFGWPFAQSNRYRWFDSLHDWKLFHATEEDEAKKYGSDDDYYVNKHCYGQSQTTCNLSLLDSYWPQCKWWNSTFNQQRTPTVKEVYAWLLTSEMVIDQTTQKKKKTSVFWNSRSLTALLICGDLVEANILPMPTANQWGKLIVEVGKGAQAGMEMFGFVQKDCSVERYATLLYLWILLFRVSSRSMKKKTWDIMLSCWNIHYARSNS
jgi:hypothetical protein